MSHVFISYARADAEFAGLLRDRLAGAGFGHWQDTEGLRAGGVWAEEIDRAIEGASALVVIVTPESKQSEYVTYEFAFAMGKGKPVIPVMLKPARAHPRLEKFQALSFTDGAAQPWDKLIERLREESDPLHPTILRLSADLEGARSAVEGMDAAKRLAWMKHPAARAALARAVNRPLPEVSFPAAVGLATFGDERAVPVLIEGLGTGTPGEAFEAFTALRNLGQKAVGGMIAALPAHSDKIESLLKLVGGEEVTPPLLEALRRGGADLRKAAAGILGRIGTRDAAAQLIEALEDEDRGVRLAATYALAAAYARNGLESEAQALTATLKLVSALREGGADVRAASAEALGVITGPSSLIERFAVPALTGALSDHEPVPWRPDLTCPYVSQAAAAALARIGGKASVPGLLRSLDGFPAHVMNRTLKEKVIEALGEAGDPAAVPALLAALGSAPTSTLAGAARALGKIGDASAVPGLTKLLKETRNTYGNDACDAAVEALERIGTREALAAARKYRRKS